MLSSNTVSLYSTRNVEIQSLTRLLRLAWWHVREKNKMEWMPLSHSFSFLLGPPCALIIRLVRRKVAQLESRGVDLCRESIWEE